MIIVIGSENRIETGIIAVLLCCRPHSVANVRRQVETARSVTMDNRTAMRWIALFLFSMMTASAAAGVEAGELKLLISIEQPTVTAPFPTRVTLHLHNSGRDTLWLYRPIRDESAPAEGTNPFASEELGSNLTSGGSTLEVHLNPAGGSATPHNESPAEGKVFESVGLPHPKLISLAPGEDDEEKTVIRFFPASATGGEARRPLWGRYKFAVTYRARYSNAQNLERILGVKLWQGEVTSHSIEVELRPPSAEAQGSVAGSVFGPDMRPMMGPLVSLSDQQEQILAQTAPDQDGRFTFAHLPFGFYWVTARRRDSAEDTAAFRHVELTAAEPAGAVQLVFLRQEIYEANRLLHKPVLFRVFNGDGQPLRDVSLDVAWSSGTVLDKVKGKVAEDGTAALELIPGRNYITLRRRGCPKQDERVDVAPGGGIDGFKFVFTCAKSR